MKNPLFYFALLIGASASIAGCSNSNDLSEEVQPPNLQVWNARVFASLDSITLSDVDKATRALFVGGNTDRFVTCWDDGDVVHVYKNGTEVGTLSPAEESWFTLSNTILNGTLTGPFAVGDELKFYLPSRVIDYTGQDGTLMKMSKEYDFQDATTTVTEAQNQILTMNNVSLTHRQGFWRMRLTDESGKRLHMKKLEVSSTSGKIVLSKSLDGTATYGNLIAEIAPADGEYPAEPFIAVSNDNVGNDTYKFKAWVGGIDDDYEDCDVYVGPSNTALTYTISRARLANIARQMKKTTAVSTLTVAEIPAQTFTGSAIEPAVTVTDGETPLTLGTDYSVSYAENVNVGTTAKVTITGLADAGALATTKYLGTQDKTFNIVKATPVIEMDDAAMTLVNNTTQNSQTRTVTRVFIDNNGNGTWDEGTDYDITALCTMTYSTDNDAVATVNAATGQVTAAGFGTTTVTATVAETETTNWTTQTATYTVDVKQEVNGQNSVNPWTSGGEPEGGKIFVE